nr:hypothetical protein [Coxiella burnetii]
MRMSEAKYGKTMMSSIVPVFRFASYGLLVENHFQSHPGFHGRNHGNLG